MKLPILISVPHCGLEVPQEVKEINLLSSEEIARDGDEQAAEIYGLAEHVKAYVTTPIARCFVDLNRAQTDRGADGVVKTHTCWQVPIYREPLHEALVQVLLEKYYHPYHQQISQHAAQVKLGIDCHTMAAVGPPVGPDAGLPRPAVCLSNADNAFPQSWMKQLAQCMQKAFDTPISLNHPFKGGYITRTHAKEIPWVQLELSRGSFCSVPEKQEKVWQGIADFYQWLQRSQK